MENCALWCVKTMNYWDQIRDYLQQKVSAESYDNWLKGTAFVGLDGDTLFVSVPDRETRAWLETEYRQPGARRQFANWGCRSSRSLTKRSRREAQPGAGG